MRGENRSREVEGLHARHHVINMRWLGGTKVRRSGGRQLTGDKVHGSRPAGVSAALRLALALPLVHVEHEARPRARVEAAGAVERRGSRLQERRRKEPR